MEQLITKTKIRLPDIKVCCLAAAEFQMFLLLSVPRGIAISLSKQGPRAQIKCWTD